MTAAPRLVPLYAHRFLPGGRGTHGNQVLSIWGDDIIGYGRDLATWAHNDFSPDREDAAAWDLGVPIPFWNEILEQAGLDRPMGDGSEDMA